MEEGDIGIISHTEEILISISVFGEFTNRMDGYISGEYESFDIIVGVGEKTMFTITFLAKFTLHV